MNSSRLNKLMPTLDTARKGDPRCRIHLDHIRRCAARVPRALNALHSTKGRDAHLDARPRCTIAERLQQISNCSSTRASRKVRSILALAHNGGELVRRPKSYSFINSRSSHAPIVT